MSYDLFSVSDIRKMETSASDPNNLMAQAAQAAALKIQEIIPFPDRPLLVFVGPGGNGGDALICSYLLKEHFTQITVVMPIINNTWLKTHTSMPCQDWIKSLPYLTQPPETLTNNTIILDGLLGTGARQHIDDNITRCIYYISQHSTTHTVISIDVPSGLDADNGQLITKEAVCADATLTFIGKKPGLFTGYGKEHTGIVHHIPLEGCPAIPAQGTLNHPALWKKLLHRKNHNSHKGTYGNVLIVGGSHGMAGAAILAARAATQSGAGKTFLYLSGEQSLFFDPLYPEILVHNDRKRFFSQDMWLEHMTATVIGPGLGLITYEATPLIKHLINTPSPLVLDADALNLISHDKKLAQCVIDRSFDTILTPHMGEMARLLNQPKEEIQANPMKAAQTLAAEYNAHVILKGSGTIICGPKNTHYFINPTGHPNMAIAGMGDILTGIIAAFIASYSVQPLMEVLLFAVYLHGYIGESLSLKGYSHTVNSTVFLSEIPHAIDRLKHDMMNNYR